MKYVLVDNMDSINIIVDLASNIGLSGARTYFKGVKRIDGNSFDKLWKVMIKDEYEKQFHSTNRPSHKDARWYEEEKAITDEELGLF